MSSCDSVLQEFATLWKEGDISSGMTHRMADAIVVLRGALIEAGRHNDQLLSENRSRHRQLLQYKQLVHLYRSTLEVVRSTLEVVQGNLSPQTSEYVFIKTIIDHFPVPEEEK